MINTRGIIFRTLKYGETSIITDIFTEDKGLLTFIGSGVRSARARMPFNLFQAMNVVDIVAYYREGTQGLQRLKEARASEVFSAIPFEIRRGAVAMFMAEVCRKAIHDAEENPELFDFLLQNLRWLDATPHPLANLHLHFLVHLSGYLGFQPQFDAEPDDQVYFDLREGVFITTPPAHGQHLEPEAAQQLIGLLESPLETCHDIPMHKVARKHLLQHLLQFYQIHLPGFGDINTPEVLEIVLE